MNAFVALLRPVCLRLARLFGLGVVLLLLGGCYTNPVTGRPSFVLISQGEELSLGQQSFAEISRAETVSRDVTQNTRVRRIGERIAQVVGEQMPNAKWEFVVFDSPQANAFALPGGKVGVYTGLLRLAENDSELAIVMGHEIGHVIARHGAERMSEAMLISGIGAVSAAAIENKTDAKTKDLFLLAYGGATTVARVLPHSRGNETEADKMGAIYAARAGYDPRAALTFWQKMAGQKAGTAGTVGSPAWLSTHPSDQKRIADLQAFMTVAVPLYEAAARPKSP